MMRICSGLVGLKSGKVEKPLVFKGFFKGQEGHEVAKKNNNRVSRGSFWSKLLSKRSKKRANEPLGIRWQDDVYMFGLGRPISENIEKPLVFQGFFEGGKVARTIQDWEKIVGKMIFW